MSAQEQQHGKKLHLFGAVAVILSPVLGKLPRPARPDPKRFANVISMDRYRELLECAPALTANDYERLANFWPMRPKLGQLGAIACLQIGKDYARTR